MSRFAGLGTQPWVVIPEFLPRETALALAADVRARRAAGELAPAAVGRGDKRVVRPDIRADLIAWLDPEHASPAEAAALGALDAARVELNRTFYLGLDSLEAHVTSYPAGAFYTRHVDNFRGSGNRKVSCILYLNDGWRAEDGGALRLYEPTDGDRHTDVLPELGTLVCFLSELVPHEVLPATRERLSLTGWFLTR